MGVCCVLQIEGSNNAMCLCCVLLAYKVHIINACVVYYRYKFHVK